MDKAEQIGIEVLARTAEVFGAEHPEGLVPQTNLAMIYLDQQRWKEALPLADGVVKMSLKLLGDKHKDTITRMEMLQVIKNGV